MIFREDFNISVDENNKVKQSDIDKAYGEFCKNYVNQIKNKLDFNCVFIEVLKENKEENQLKKNPTTLRKEIKNTEEVVKKMIRFEMIMIKPPGKIKRSVKIRKPKISRLEQDKEKTEKIRSERRG